MDSFSLDDRALPASVKVSRFHGRDGVDEYHLMAFPGESGSFDAQLDGLSRAYRSALDSIGLDEKTAILRRFFCRDLPNQAVALDARPFSAPRATDNPCAVSWVCQPPRPSADISLWAYHVTDPGGAPDKIREDGSLTLRRGPLAHHWTTGMTCPAVGTSHDQTRGILEEYVAFLRPRGMSLADHVIRTWFFVRDIDANYRGLVAARREFFAGHGLTADTHFIASTGVGGTHVNAAATVTMDAYAISGIGPGQIRFLKAPGRLSPTHVYGVTFERGTSIAYRDRRHVILSGTASIDSGGRVVHPGDVRRQLDRTIGNMEALLGEAGATLKDMAMMIGYVRNPGDHALVERNMRERFGDTPMMFVRSPICRPGWLVEIEGLAIIPASNSELPAF